MVALPPDGSGHRRAVHVEHVAARLRSEVSGEVRFDAGSRALYAVDAGNYRQVPVGVVIPRSTHDVVRTVAVCHELGVPILGRGGGTSLAGQCCNVAVVIDFTKHLDQVLQVEPRRGIARVQPGLVLDDLKAAVEPFGWTWGPGPATHDRCTLGGMIGNDSCGVYSILGELHGCGPRTSDHVVSLDVLTYDGARFRVGKTTDEEIDRAVAEGGRRGEILARLRSLRDRYAPAIRRLPKISRRVSGYSLDALLPENGFDVARLLVGSECTLALVLEATLRLDPHLPARTLVVLGYPSVFEAADHVTEIRRFRPVGLEGLDDRLVDYMRRKGLRVDALDVLPDGEGWLLVEFGGHTPEEAGRAADAMIAALRRLPAPPRIHRIDDPVKIQEAWEIRESGLGATAFVPGEGDSWPGWEDSAVPPERVGAYLRELRALLDRHGYACSLYGHFGQGCIHTRIDFDFTTDEGRRTYRRFTEEAADLVVRHGGSLSGEHGDGQARGELLERMVGPELMQAFRELKRIWDPSGGMNPGKLVDARSRTADLRLADFPPAEPTTRFAYPEDGGSFAHAALRCVGVGACRRSHGGTMCPSFMVTKEEMHTTRGRAHLLYEMLVGEVITGGWRDRAVHESLDLCLSCKGCKGDCPVDVDIATYKAEFLSRYHAWRLRPRHAYAFGLIDVWAPLAAKVAWLANLLTQVEPAATIARWLAGVDPGRRLPRFAPKTFRARHASRGHGARPGARRVLLWPDTFNEHFHPEVLEAAVQVLEDAGCEVVLPRQALCCGRPLYDFGMLGRAERLFRQVLDALDDEIAAGTPVVGVEPSCVAAFRDELPNLMHGDPRARRLAERTFTLGELLVRELPRWDAPRLEGKVLLHGHCHHVAIMKLDAEIEVLERMGLEVERLDSGCCGMAGSFGYERGKLEISQAIGERVLLPAVRRAPPEVHVLADGFSCRTQVAELAGRLPVHLAELVALGLERREQTGRRAAK